MREGFIVILDGARCPQCGADKGQSCSDPDENHSARLHEFIENAGYLDRREAHLSGIAQLRARGLPVNERLSLFLTDEEILGLYGAETE